MTIKQEQLTTQPEVQPAAQAFDQATQAAREEQNDALSVSAAVGLAKKNLESLVVTLIGEVSEVSIRPGYKAAYFTVKDEGASLPCMMWNNRYAQAQIDLQVGQLVRLTGRFSIYAPKGRMNFEVFSIALSGEGELRLRVANLAKKLQAEGLMDPSKKRVLPLFPERIGLVTSPRSAAVHDVLRTLRRRFPLAQVLLAGIPVEGTRAPADIQAGIQAVEQAGAEVILVVRGGGSFEDMMPFNDESLARTIAACSVPVVTGIGHEVDTSIADMVADVRASTPTAAAEAVSPAREALSSELTSDAQALAHAMKRRLERTHNYLARVSEKPLFENPLMLFATSAQWLDDTQNRLQNALPSLLQRQRTTLSEQRLRLRVCGNTLLSKHTAAFAQAAGHLNDLSPLGVLGRGYAIAQSEHGTVISHVHQVRQGESIQVLVSDGTISCNVESTQEIEPEKVF